MERGKFIVFEGIDGSGKSTQIDYLARHLRSRDKYNEVLLAREPTRGATEVVRRLRESADPNSDVRIMAEGYVEDRKKHWRDVIGPLLSNGTHVICDRYTLSTLAYQSTQGVPLNILREMHETKRIGCPDFTFYLDVPVSIAQERMKRRGDAPEKFDNPDFQEMLARNYEEIISLSRSEIDLKNLVGRVEKFDANQSIDRLAAYIRRVYDSILSK